MQVVYGDGESNQALELPVYDESDMEEPLWEEPDREAIENLNRALAAAG